MTDGVFDASVAATYDRDHKSTSEDLAVCVDQLTALAKGGPVLEFAVGTGRVALPLAKSGLTVKGIELSAAMVAELRKKETGAPLEVIIGDMTTAKVEGTFSLVALVFNTIDNLTTQDTQVACFQNAAHHLGPGGRFVVETLVPPLQDLPFGETHRAFAAGPDHMGTDTFDVVTQTYTSHHMRITPQGPHQLSVPFRYGWPAEFDLMARIAGMTLEHRWSDWDKAPFTRHSRRHISIYRLTA